MNEYIKKEDALKAMTREGVTKNMRAHRAVQAIQGANVEPVIDAEWLPSNGAWRECSHCHEEEFCRICNTANVVPTAAQR